MRRNATCGTVRILAALGCAVTLTAAQAHASGTLVQSSPPGTTSAGTDGIALTSASGAVHPGNAGPAVVAGPAGPVTPDTQPSLPAGSTDTTAQLNWTQPVDNPGSTTLLVVGLIAYSPTGFGPNGSLSATDAGTPMSALTPMASSPDGTIRGQLFGIYTSLSQNTLAAFGMGDGTHPSAKLACAKAFYGVSDGLAGDPPPVAASATANTFNASNQISTTTSNATAGQALVSVFGVTRNATDQTLNKGAVQTLDCGPLSFTSSTTPNAYIALDHILIPSNGVVTEVWQTNQTGQKPVLASVLLNPQPSPTAARVSRFSAQRHGATMVFRWHSTAHVAGFNLFAGHLRLNHHLIRAHAAAGYRYTVHYRGRGPYSVRAVLPERANRLDRFRELRRRGAPFLARPF